MKENTGKENTIGQRIKAQRTRLHITQEELVEALHTKKCAISAYENDRIDIKSSILLEIASELNCTSSYLLEGKETIEMDDRFRILLSKIQDEHIKEIVYRQLEVLASLG